MIKLGIYASDVDKLDLETLELRKWTFNVGNQMRQVEIDDQWTIKHSVFSLEIKLCIQIETDFTVEVILIYCNSIKCYKIIIMNE